MKTTMKFFLVAAALWTTATVYTAAQERYTPQDSIKAEKIMTELSAKKSLSSGLLMKEAAMKMLGTPYVGGTLDVPEKETLTVSHPKPDGILFVDTCLNMVLCAQQGKTHWSDLCGMIRESRYRNGLVGSYLDRIHYTTEWIRKGEDRGILEDLTVSLGGENNVNQKPVTYIPKEIIPSVAGHIKTGDIICFVTTTAGLDISHVAIAYVHDGIVGFIHASSIAKKVIVDAMSIANYTASISGCKGIKVVRVAEKPSPVRYHYKYQGLDREYYLYIPPKVSRDKSGKKYPLVFVVHGYGQQAPGYVPEMMDVAREEGFAVCYPQGRRNSAGKAGWNVRYTVQVKDGNMDDDEALLTFLARKLQEEYNFSPENTFLTGMSNGGDMCYLLAYYKDSPFTALASVAGQTMKWVVDERHQPARPIPFMEIHGTADQSAKWNGDMANKGGWGAYLSVPDGVGAIVKADSCDTHPSVMQLPKKYPGSHAVSCTTWSGGVPVWENGPACEVCIFKIEGGNHSWALNDMETCQEIWDFFKQYLR